MGGWKVRLKTISSSKTCMPVHPTMLCAGGNFPQGLCSSSKRTRAPFPWACPLLPQAMASTIWFKPAHRVTSSCQELRHQKCNPRTRVFNSLLNHRMTLFILPLVKSFDIRGKSVLFKHHQAFALPVLQQVLNCLLSPALFLLTEDQTRFYHLRLCTALKSCLPRFYT